MQKILSSLGKMPSTVIAAFRRLQWQSIVPKIRIFVSALHWRNVTVGFLSPVLLFGIYSLIWGEQGSGTAVASQTVAVERRDIVSSIKALGKVTLANEQQLRFNQIGKVAAVYVKEGETVQKDDLIAELDKADPEADIRQAELSLNDAYLSLKELQAGLDSQKIDLENAKRNLERQLEEGTQNVPIEQEQVAYAIQDAEGTVREKEAAVAQAQRNLESTKQTEVQGIGQDIADALSDTDDFLDSLYTLLCGDDCVRDTRSNEDLEVDFASKSQDIKDQAGWSLIDALNTYTELRDSYGYSIALIDDEQQLSLILKSALHLAEKLVVASEQASSLLQQGTPLDTGRDLSALKSTAITLRSDATTILASLQTAQAGLSSGISGESSDIAAIRDKEEALKTAEQNLADAQDTLQVLQMKKERGTSDADTSARDLATLQDELEAKKASTSKTLVSLDVQINQKQLSVSQKKVALEKAKRVLEKYELRAPFTGVIRSVDFQVGDNLLADANETKYVVLENNDYLVVTVQLDQVDVVHVREGQPASIVFDALPGEKFTGTVDKINTTPIEASGVVSYEVEIALEKTDHTILSGMTATVQIETASATNILSVPNLSLQKAGSRTIVKMEDGSSVPVETGITDGRYTEITSGLQEGEMIQSVSMSVASQSSSQASGNNRSGGFPLGGGMGGVPH